MQIRPAQTLFCFIFVSFLLPYFHPLVSHLESVKPLTVYFPAFVHSHHAVQACSEMFPPPHPATTGPDPSQPHLVLFVSFGFYAVHNSSNNRLLLCMVVYTHLKHSIGQMAVYSWKTLWILSPALHSTSCIFT